MDRDRANNLASQWLETKTAAPPYNLPTLEETAAAMVDMLVELVPRDVDEAAVNRADGVAVAVVADQAVYALAATDEALTCRRIPLAGLAVVLRERRHHDGGREVRVREWRFSSADTSAFTIRGREVLNASAGSAPDSGERLARAAAAATGWPI